MSDDWKHIAELARKLVETGQKKPNEKGGNQ